MLPVVLTIVLSLVSITIALRSLHTSRSALRNSYRPLVRPSPQFAGGHPPPLSTQLLVKNYGNGPAMSIVVFEAVHGHPIIGTFDVLEKLGAFMTHIEGDKYNRVGRERVAIASPHLALGHHYGVAYQDLEGTWHLTQFSVHEKGFDVWYRGPEQRIRWFLMRGPEIPKSVKQRGQVAFSVEGP